MIRALRGVVRALLFAAWTAGIAAAWLIRRRGMRGAARHLAPHGARTLHLWARGTCRILGLRVEASGSACRSAVLCVSNHTGYLDIVVLAATGPSLFVSKDDLARWPVLGSLAASVGTVFLDRTRARGVVDAAARMADLFTAGVPVILFPEGTTTDGGRYGHEPAPFHAALFDPAIRAGVPVQAVALDYRKGRPFAVWTGHETFLPHFWKLLCTSGVTVRARYAEPVPGHTNRHVAAGAARSWIVETLRSTTDAHEGNRDEGRTQRGAGCGDAGAARRVCAHRIAQDSAG